MSQVLGAATGAAVTYILYWDKISVGAMNLGVKGPPSIFVTYPDSSVSLLTSFLNETLATMFLLMAVFAVTDPHEIEAPHSKWHVAGFLGITITLLGLAFGLNSGCAMNPARDFGPRVFLFCAGWGWEAFSMYNYYFWVPIVAPTIGAVLGASVQNILVFSKVTELKKSLTTETLDHV